MATTILRRPLTTRQPEQSAWAHRLGSPLAAPPVRAQPLPAVNSYKRPRSPDADDATHAANAKRVKSTPLSTTTTTNSAHATNARDAQERNEKLRQKEEREQARKEFITKYTKAFPSFVFYFDDCEGKQQAESRVLVLGARIERFFSAAVTHVITNHPQPPKDEQYDPSNKENDTPRPAMKGNLLKSPIQLKGRAHTHGGYDKLVRDAVQLNKKIWSMSKLDNILSRLIPTTAAASKAKVSQQSTQLTQLLQHERLHGTTSERDPRERRHDFQYFSKQSHFFLVEDIWGELAPIGIMEYPAPKSGRSAEKDKSPAYPVLYMDPRARSPFVKFDEKEERKQQKIEQNERVREKEKERSRSKLKEQLKLQQLENIRKTKNLRRCVSMSQLSRRAVSGDLGELEAASGSDGLSISIGIAGDKTTHQQIASGFGPSTTGNGYLAASGNSVAITSTTTTSYTRTLGSSRLPLNLREQLGRQVVTSRRLEGASGKENENPFGEPRLRKAKSTTTMRLPTREESKKPGYCEACRTKFEDFKQHVGGSRHRKFAQNENNYIDLDFLLGRLQRKITTDASSDAGSEEVDVGRKDDDPPSDACLGPGDYFYLSPEQVLEAEADAWEGVEENDAIPQIVIDGDCA